MYSAEECSELESPRNGAVDVDKRLYPGEATYSCDSGFELDGVSSRKCQINGTWEEDAPLCVDDGGSECDLL